MLWKAFIVVFVMSDLMPPGMMIGQWGRTFLSEKACREFLASADIEAKLASIPTDENHNFRVITHETSCIPDETGQPT